MLKNYKNHDHEQSELLRIFSSMDKQQSGLVDINLLKMKMKLLKYDGLSEKEWEAMQNGYGNGKSFDMETINQQLEK